MIYNIILAPSAARQLRKFDPDVRRRIQAALELLAAEPRPPAATRLVGGSGEWRVRTGNYRIVYEIKDDELLVLVLRIGHRREVYGREVAGLVPVSRSAMTPDGTVAALRTARSGVRRGRNSVRRMIDEGHR